MVIEIRDTKTIKEIQDAFSHDYPYLKLEFFEEPHDVNAGSDGVKLQPVQAIGDVRRKHVYGIITLEPDRLTASVEQEFEDRFGLHVQICRRLYDKWVQTIQTDSLSLEQQNAMGRDSATFFNPDHQFTAEDIDLV